MSLGEDSEILYRGRIRAGAPGVLTAGEHTVRRRREYDVAFLTQREAVRIPQR